MLQLNESLPGHYGWSKLKMHVQLRDVNTLWCGDVMWLRSLLWPCVVPLHKLFYRSAHMDTMYSGQQYQIGPNRISCFLTTLWLRTPYMTWVLHQIKTDGKQEYVPKDQLLLWDYFEEWIRSYDKHQEAMTSNTIMTVLWQAISNQSDSDPHFDSGVGTPFRLTCFDLYTVHFTRTTQTRYTVFCPRVIKIVWLRHPVFWLHGDLEDCISILHYW